LEQIIVPETNTRHGQRYQQPSVQKIHIFGLPALMTDADIVVRNLGDATDIASLCQCAPAFLSRERRS
jgi:hypothetical protein